MTSATRIITLATVTLCAGHASAAITVTQTFDSQVTYSDHLITFDEPGVPTGAPTDPFDHYLASDGVYFTSGSGFLVADDWDTLEGIDGGEGDGNQLAGGFSVRMVFDHDVSALNFQGWAQGNPAPPFGGINVLLFNDGAQVGAYNGTFAPFGGAGDEWFNVVADGGDVFDEVRFFNPAFNSFAAYVDNISWDVAAVPAPGAFALLGMAGLAARRRRRG